MSMPNIPQSEFNRAIRSFLMEATGQAEVQVAPDENLFAAGVLSSLQVPALIVFLEELTKCELALEETPMTAFYTMESMYTAFVRPES